MIANHEPNPQDGRYSSRYLSRKRFVNWDDPAYTVMTSARDISIHPCEPAPKGDDSMKPLLDALPRLSPNGLTSIELFAGGGLMRLGIEHAGITTIWANDFDKNACRAHEHNFGAGSIVQGDITQIPIEAIPDADLVIGGPPCQRFSFAGKGDGDSHETGKLVWRYLDIIVGKRPRAFMFENVEGLISSKHRHTFFGLIANFEILGYSVGHRLINAWDYGVAQQRKRIFLIGIRRDSECAETASQAQKLLAVESTLRLANSHLSRVKSNPLTKKYEKAWQRKVKSLIREGDAILAKLHTLHETDGTAFKWPRSEYETSGYRPVLRDAIGDLPEPGVKLNDAQEAYLTRNPASVAKNRPVTMDEPSRTIPAVRGKGVPYGLFVPDAPVANHDDKPLTNAVYRHARDHRIGYNTSLDAPAVTVRTKGEDVLDVANHGIGDYWTPKSDYTYDQANRVQSMDAPCNTIPAHHNSGQPIHPTQKPRRFTVRECLRIQSVPDTYVFPDYVIEERTTKDGIRRDKRKFSLSAMYRVVGNGVASRVAYHLGAALSAQLLAALESQRREEALNVA